jgi:ankyrin repeat-rich membrane spanning protein
MVKMLLEAKVDAEIGDVDGQTPLLLASRKKNANIVNELLNYGCKLSTTDRNGDNPLHISIRNRNRDITELLLSNPKNSKYLYKPNKRGETPYKIDANNPKSIITQIFGASKLNCFECKVRRKFIILKGHLNMTEDSILGYDLYSSALAEILSEPSLNTPITVGLYAKWGSGKSFLLAQLKGKFILINYCL